MPSSSSSLDQQPNFLLQTGRRGSSVINASDLYNQQQQQQPHFVQAGEAQALKLEPAGGQYRRNSNNANESHLINYQQLVANQDNSSSSANSVPVPLPVNSNSSSKSSIQQNYKQQQQSFASSSNAREQQQQHSGAHIRDDIYIVFNKLMALEAFRKLHPTIIRNLCSYAFIERIDKGVIGKLLLLLNN